MLGVEKGCDSERPVPFEIAADDGALGTSLILETLGKEAAAGVVVIEKNRIRNVCPPASRTKPSDLLEAPLLEESFNGLRDDPDVPLFPVELLGEGGAKVAYGLTKQGREELEIARDPTCRLSSAWHGKLDGPFVADIDGLADV